MANSKDRSAINATKYHKQQYSNKTAKKTRSNTLLINKTVKQLTATSQMFSIDNGA